MGSGVCTDGAVKDDDGTCATDTCDEADFGGVAQACCKAAPPCDFAGAGAAVIHDVNPSSIVTWYGSWVGGGAEIQKIRADSPTPSLVGLRMCARPICARFRRVYEIVQHDRCREWHGQISPGCNMYVTQKDFDQVRHQLDACRVVRTAACYRVGPAQ